MTPSQQAKAAGLKNLSIIVEMAGYTPDGKTATSLQTLDNWSREKPGLFKIAIAGCVSIIKAEKETS